jgi:hypothetical protein
MVLMALAAAPTLPGTAGLYRMKWISKFSVSAGRISQGVPVRAAKLQLFHLFDQISCPRLESDGVVSYLVFHDRNEFIL